ncbi:MAG TPA: transglycosylase SLT domain-containing protein [Gemmatimonadales bacterium]|nr:transglycosylase SLT domain-containing protein [Gemmatimonadales bacterium]
MTLTIQLLITLAARAVQIAAPTPQVPELQAPETAMAADPATADDSTLAAAMAALARGLPWRATRLLDPMLRDSATRTPEALLLAATAASRWGGWNAVERLLGAEPDSTLAAGGVGRILLARAALEAGRDSLAAARAAALLGAAAPPERRGAALVTLARALERLGAHDTAAATWLRAAEAVPLAADWLKLRAAGAMADSSGRWGLYTTLGAAARAHIPETEAALRERLGDDLGAAKAYAALGDRISALRLRLVAANAPGGARAPALGSGAAAALGIPSVDSAARNSVRRELIDAIIGGTAAEARGAVALLDSAFGAQPPEDELAIARGAVAAGAPERAVEGFDRAFDAGLGGTSDRFDLATSLGRLGRYDRAAVEFGRVPASDSLGGAAAYQRARAMLRGGDEPGAVRALRKVAASFRKDSAAAAPALVLLADLATDDHRESEARRLFARAAKMFPRSRFAAAAWFRSGLIALLEGRARTAAKELDGLARSGRAGEEGLAARYWSGRAWEAAGDSARARERWSALASDQPASYYAGLVDQRLDIDPWAPPAAADSFASYPDLDTAMARAAELDRLGLAREAAWEYADIAGDANGSVERLLATADAFRAQGLGAQAIQLARRALARGAPADARLYRLLYPVVRPDALMAAAEANGLDPSLVAALIRQESLFNPLATSRAGARGLMQVMPDLGRKLAEAQGFPEWDPVLLYQPDVSLELGTAHLGDLARQLPDVPRLLAAYNAGISRVARWQTKTGANDPEVFAERIPFVETRDYVRIIQRNEALYRALYSWEATGPEPTGGVTRPQFLP